jgi:ribosomal protein S27AE
MSISEAKATVLEIMEQGHLSRHYQRLRLEYMRGVGDLTPICILALNTTDREREKPMSYRTNNPIRLRQLIQGLIKMLHRLESDIADMKRRDGINHGCPKCGSGSFSEMEQGRFYCSGCGHVFPKKDLANADNLKNFVQH